MVLLSIHNPFNAPVYHEETVTSTMDIARKLAARGEPHGTVVTADFQEAGRGRIRGRIWGMERNASLPFTILLRYPRIEDIPTALTLRTGLAAALAIEDFIPELRGAVMVKWPNDIMILPPYTGSEGFAKKIAGILTEADGGMVFTGIGINMTQREFPLALAKKAASISMAAGRDIEPEERFVLLEKILARLHSGLETAESRHEDWRSRLEARLYKKDEPVCFIEGAADSGRIIEGRLAGIGTGGEILICPKGENKPTAYTTGELRVY